MSASATSYSAYRRVDVETASQGKLIAMLFNGAIQRAEEAKRQIERNNIGSVHNNLIRAQEIVAELRGALNMEAGQVAENLDRIYDYCHHLLVQANIKKDVALLDEAAGLLTQLRDTWHELFEKLAEEGQSPSRELNPHGANMINVQG